MPDQTTQRPTFETKDREHIYDYVAAHEPVDSEELYDADVVRVEPERYLQLVAVMKRDGHLRVRDGKLYTARDRGTAEEHRGEEFEFTIRPARQEDLSGIIGVIRQVTEDRTYIEAETVAQQLEDDDALLRYGETEERKFFVAIVDGEVVGWVNLTIPEQEKLSHTAELTLGLLEEFRGRGIGSHLMQRSLSWATTQGLLKVYNSVPATNQAAVEFLQAHDWAVEAVRHDHYLINGTPVDEVMMALEF